MVNGTLKLVGNYKASSSFGSLRRCPDKMATARASTVPVPLRPLRMIIKLYSLYIIGWDLGYFMVASTAAIFKSLFALVWPPELKSVDQEIVLVVGSSRGVGREISKSLARLRACVICVDINTAANETTVADIRDAGGRAYAFTCDVTDLASVRQTLATIATSVGRLTMLIHCCGVPSPRSLVDPPPSVQSTLDLINEILPIFKRSGHGHIVLLTSVAGISGINQQMPLSVSQFAVHGVFESILEDIRISKLNETIRVSIAHIYPLIVSDDLAQDIRMRIASHFGTIDAADAANRILDSVRRNYIEISIPRHLLYVGNLFKLFPKKVVIMLRDVLETGLDFG